MDMSHILERKEIELEDDLMEEWTNIFHEQ